MSSTSDYTLIPVRRRSRRDWQIPLDAYVRAQEGNSEGENMKQYAGTTALGREIFRRTVYLAWKAMEENRDKLQAIKEVRAQFEEFPELREEFVLLLSNQWQKDPEEVRQSTCQGWATLLVLEARAGQNHNKAVQENPA